MLLRDVAYGQIPRAARAEKHRRAAEWIESLGRVSDHAELLAGHYASALEYVRASGSRRARARPSAPASRCARRVSGRWRCPPLPRPPLSSRTRSPSQVRMTRHGRGSCCSTHARCSASAATASSCSTEALDGFRALADAEGAAEAATLAARFAWFAGDRASADRYIALALEAVASHPRSRARALALTQQTGFLMLGGRYAESILVGGEARPLVDELGMDEQRARLHIVVGCARCCLGDQAGLDEIEAGIEACGGLRRGRDADDGLPQPLVRAPLLRQARRGATSVA